MKIQLNQQKTDAIQAFCLPRYVEIPTVGLYLNQVAKYINEIMAPFSEVSITESMISNYVKKRLIPRPVRKQYDSEQIAYLIFITLAKSVLSMEDIDCLFSLQRKTYSTQRAYDYFCGEFENVLHYVFGWKEQMAAIGEDKSDLKELLRSAIITLVRKLYLNECFSALKEHQEEGISYD